MVVGMAIFTIVGSIIGAGFASGQEIYLFFYRYGIRGLYGLLICSFLISYIIYKVLNIVYDENIDSYQLFLEKIFNKNLVKKKYLDLSYINNKIVNIFLIFTFFIMVAGFGAYFSQELGLSKILGSIIIASCAFFIFMTNMKGLTKLNTVIIPILIGCMVLIGIKNIPNIEITKINLENKYSFRWIIKAIIYGSYNIILLIPVLVNLKSYIKSKKNILWVSIFSGLIFFVLSICVFFMLVNVDVSFNNLEMPVIYVVKTVFPKFKIIYGMVILISIFTTATSVGISFLENVCKNKKSYTQIAVIMCITSVLFSNFGFSNMVKLLFPVFGYLGLVQIALIVTTNFHNFKKCIAIFFHI